jgi:FkbM family methyltransferase
MIPDQIKRSSILLNFQNRAQLLINRLFFKSTGSTIYRYDDMEILIDHNGGDQDGTRSCLFPGLYDPCIEALTELPGKLSILDLGANGGGFLLALRKHRFEIERAVVVELNPHTWSRLTLNLFRNIPHAHERLKILNGAAGSSDGSITIGLGRGSVGDSVATGVDPTKEQFVLPTYSLETLLSYFPAGREIDLCKIDIEGAEYEMFDSLSPASFARIKALVIEIHDMPGRKPADALKFLEDCGFEAVAPTRPLVESNVYLFRKRAK